MISEDDPRVSQIGHPAPPWLINYADLMTELVCFFVILYALSAALNKDMQNAKDAVEEMVKSGQMQGEVKMDKEGMRITLEEQGEFSFFESGRAEITGDMLMKLDKLAAVLRKLSEKSDIVVEGHTDNVPIKTKQFETNWELSTARATSVVRHFLNSGFEPRRMSAIGYGEFHPSSPNDNPVNRRKNRRVVFFIKANPYPDAAAAKAGYEQSRARAAAAAAAIEASTAAPSALPAEGQPAGEVPAEEQSAWTEAQPAESEGGN